MMEASRTTYEPVRLLVQVINLSEACDPAGYCTICLTILQTSPVVGSCGSVCGKLWRRLRTCGSSAHHWLPILLDRPQAIVLLQRLPPRYQTQPFGIICSAVTCSYSAFIEHCIRKLRKTRN